ncbi:MULTISPECIES: co-chaperone GroES [Sphingomonadales]|jgi:chaperonin GroES|uniref:Co-chaperonin GroES n=2 Tax=Sphingomonadales TaxID=204457 RepID=A0ABQ2JW37_9SPHN|nr:MULTISPECIES: co-chaperone GroES [Sphingomonadales]HSG22341.1 co-chaperone GroES [Azonexus sp.]MBX7501863.1 co-chaperone GroES [Qipengyuania mesophila]MCZ8020008.1 co-chaperone GroES [Novosphingobium sp.]MCZ8035653.1 co-chaperone GroES [Novosphingobium sp.]MCZ8053051.1 co-chaperone GroES [Novosphingobium sp.]
MHFRPLHDRVLVRRIEAEEKTAGGIIIPDTAKEKPMEGEVVAVGPGARDDSGKLVEPAVKAGDRVLFGKWSGTEVRIDGEDLLIMKESDILGIIETTAELKKAA